MSLAAGTKLGPQRILSPLGAAESFRRRGGTDVYACVRNFDFSDARLDDRSPCCST